MQLEKNDVDFSLNFGVDNIERALPECSIFIQIGLYLNCKKMRTLMIKKIF